MASKLGTIMSSLRLLCPSPCVRRVLFSPRAFSSLASCKMANVDALTQILMAGARIPTLFNFWFFGISRLTRPSRSIPRLRASSTKKHEGRSLISSSLRRNLAAMQANGSTLTIKCPKRGPTRCALLVLRQQCGVCSTLCQTRALKAFHLDPETLDV
ncbi:hypothetical protein BOTBODRAFT_58679 [Botryobasidium botryosum FD-172 SS1]|uniref:Uncharacterized protein n=1 Tax=Botryobasidium botryosum (strain FD-172 SS1) TaxID=930990 RepID=A0A067M453_BOTB1|nr:hypothetical protein BOTBODRAFT_58679 [Botryobasidium botryosum FD-172 SS1]